MSSANKNGHRSHKEWIKHAKAIRKDRDIKIYKFLNTLKGEDSNYSKLLESLPEELSPENLYRMPISQLRSIVLKKQISAENLLTIFYARALPIGMKLEGLADVNIERAFEIAKLRDEEIADIDQSILDKEAEKDQDSEDQSKYGLLFGVPISVKDTYQQKGKF